MSIVDPPGQHADVMALGIPQQPAADPDMLLLEERMVKMRIQDECLEASALYAKLSQITITAPITPSRFISQLEMHEQFLSPMLSTIRGQQCFISQARKRLLDWVKICNATVFVINNIPSYDWQVTLGAVLRRHDPPTNTWRWNCDESYHWSIMRQEAENVLKSQEIPIIDAAAMNTVLEALLHQYRLVQALAKPAGHLPDTDELSRYLYRIKNLREKKYTAFIIWRTPEMNELLRDDEISGLDLDDLVAFIDDTLKWAWAWPYGQDQLGVHDHYAKAETAMAEENAFVEMGSGTLPQLNNWPKHVPLWKDPIEHDNYFTDHPEVLGNQATNVDRYISGFGDKPNSEPHGRMNNFAWTVRSIAFGDGYMLVTIYDLPPGAFIGVVSGWVRYGIDAEQWREDWLRGPNGIFLEPTPSPLYRVLHPRFGKAGNVLIGWEFFGDKDRQCYRFLAFAARRISAFEELSI